jgi:uncharacterized membrane protein
LIQYILSPARQANSSRAHQWVFWLLLLSGLILRLLWLGGKSFWLDEANSLHIAQLGQPILWAGQSETYHPPLFYILLELWSKLGKGEFILRLPIAIIGAACTWLIYKLVIELTDQQTALSAAGLVAFSPLLVWYSQELRPYMILAAFSLTNIWAFIHLLKHPTIGGWIITTLLMTFALYLHYLAVLLIVAQAALVIIFVATRHSNWAGIFSWLIALFCSVISYLPWISSPAFRQFVRLGQSNKDYITALFVDRFNIALDWSILTRWMLLIGLPIAALIGIGLFLVIRQTIQMNTLGSLREQAWLRVLSAALFIILLALSVIPRGYSLKRQVIFILPFVLMIFAWLWPWGGKSHRLLTILLGLSLLASLINVLVIPKDQWREAASYISEHSQPGDVVILEPIYMTIPFDFYNSQSVERIGVNFGEIDVVHEVLCQHQRAWLLLHRTDRDPQGRLEYWMNQNSVQLASVNFYGLRILLYRLGSPCS